MMTNTTTDNSADGHHVRVDPAGRVLVPAAVRARHNIRPGDTLVVRSHDDGVELRTYEQVVREAQDYFRALAPDGRLLSQELIEERRREAAKE
jgi:AbrB family looped-hinge helix DNA binding protein